MHQFYFWKLNFGSEPPRTSPPQTHTHTPSDKFALVMLEQPQISPSITHSLKLCQSQTNKNSSTSIGSNTMSQGKIMVRKHLSGSPTGIYAKELVFLPIPHLSVQCTCLINVIFASQSVKEGCRINKILIYAYLLCQKKKNLWKKKKSQIKPYE